MQPIPIRTPTSIGNIEIRLYDLVIYPDGELPKQAAFDVEVLDQDG